MRLMLVCGALNSKIEVRVKMKDEISLVLGLGLSSHWLPWSWTAVKSNQTEVPVELDYYFLRF